MIGAQEPTPITTVDEREAVLSRVALRDTVAFQRLARQLWIIAKETSEAYRSFRSLLEHQIALRNSSSPSNGTRHIVPGA